MSINLFSLGEIWVSDFLRDGEQQRGGKHELKLVMEEDTKLVHLETTVPLETMFGEYWYKSGLNPQMVSQLSDIVESILPLIKFNETNIWCDVACNDGTLLNFVSSRFIKVGIDPIEDKFKKKAEQYADLIIQDYFSADVYKKSKFGNHKVNVLTAIAVFYDIENPDKFLQDVYEVLDDEGLFVMQLSHSGLMIKQLAFDNILSEHWAYYTLSSLIPYLQRNGFYVADCQLNDTNGGSFRVYIKKVISDEKKFATQPYRDVCKFRVESLYEYEWNLRLREPQIWIDFFTKVQNLKEQVIAFVKSEKEKGKTFWGLAASTKGNTALQYFGLDHTLIDGIAERNPDKFGLKTVATNIPIFSEEDFRKAAPDYAICLAWHFVSSFMEREMAYLEGGGKIIVTMPKFLVITKEDL